MAARTHAARIACFTLPVHGHVTPMLAVLTELTERGASVTALGTEGYTGALEATGAAAAAYPPSLAARVARPSHNFLEVAALLATLTADSMLDHALAHLRETEPEVVVIDSMAPWGRLAARMLGLPVVTSTPSFLIDARLGASRRGAADLARRAAASGSSLATITRIDRALRRRGGVGCGGPISLLSNRGDATLVYTSRGLQPGGERFGPDVHFVGPTAAERPIPPIPSDDPLTAALAAADRGDELIYLSLGTLYNDRPAFLRACVEALAGPGRQLVISLGHEVSPAALGSLPPGVVASAAPPQLAVLNRASLFVTHGGMNSVHEALWRGVPMVLFPQAADQPVVAARVEQLGAGRVLRGREPGAAEIRGAAEQVLAGGGAAARAAALGAALRAAGGAGAAADVILRLAAPSA